MEIGDNVKFKKCSPKTFNCSLCDWKGRGACINIKPYNNGWCYGVITSLLKYNRLKVNINSRSTVIEKECAIKIHYVQLLENSIMDLI